MARASTRSSARLNSSQESPDQKASPETGTKRKADASESPSGKRGRPKKEQKTIEETLPDLEHEKNGDAAAGLEENGAEENGEKANGHKENGHAEKDDAENGDAGLKDVDMKDVAEKVEADQDAKSNGDDTKADGTPKQEEKKDDAAPRANGDAGSKEGKSMTEGEDAGKDNDTKAKGATDGVAAVKEDKDEGKSQDTSKAITNGDGAVESSQGRGYAMPSNMLEKGIIYFFFRSRVGVDNPESVQDVARSYIVLRPLPDNAKLGDGPIDDLKNARLLALPKKVLPRSHRDVFMSFVEKSGASIADLKEEFMQGSTYSTQTTGVRQSPPVTPIAEGVYSITVTDDRTSHLAYMLTIPTELGQVQEEMGLADKGSFVLSTKNPDQKGPANASLPQGPDFSKEIMEEFRGRRWMPLHPSHLEYANAQFLLIGESHGDLGKAVQGEEKDEKDDSRHTPIEEMEKLEGEDLARIKHLKGDDTVFVDLDISKKEYPAVPTTW